jgi:proteasome accessory factor B
VLVRTGAGLALRRDAETIEAGVAGPDDRTGWDRLVVSRSGLGLVDDLLGYGDDLYVEEPADLRETVIARLRAVLDGGAA